MMPLNRTHRLIFRGAGCRGGSDSGGGGYGGGGFVSRCSQKHNLTLDEHWGVRVLFLRPPHLNRTKKLTTTEEEEQFFEVEKPNEEGNSSLSLCKNNRERDRDRGNIGQAESEKKQKITKK